MIWGQNSQLTPAAQKLLKRPRLGSAQLTWVDGRTQKGRVVRVTDQFISFETNITPPACENVELSNVAAVQWFERVGAGSHSAGEVLLGTLLAPFYVGSVATGPFKRISPPTKPLHGSWEPSRPPRGLVQSSFVFEGNVVQYRTVTAKRGRWSIEQDQLRMTFGGEPDSIASFHFECGDLILGDSANTFRDWSDHKRASPPIVGDWHDSNRNLELSPDGSTTERTWGVRKGTFENSATSVKMHWADSTAPGGMEWVGRSSTGIFGSLLAVC